MPTYNFHLVRGPLLKIATINFSWYRNSGRYICGGICLLHFSSNPPNSPISAYPLPPPPAVGGRNSGRRLGHHFWLPRPFWLGDQHKNFVGGLWISVTKTGEAVVDCGEDLHRSSPQIQTVLNKGALVFENDIAVWGSNRSPVLPQAAQPLSNTLHKVCIMLRTMVGTILPSVGHPKFSVWCFGRREGG